MLSKIENNKIIYAHDNCVTEFFGCICNSDEHLVRFSYFVEKDGTVEDEGLYISVHLHSSQGFWGRVKRAFSYVFRNAPSRYGEWDEVIFKRQDAERLKSLLDTYINSEVTKYDPTTIPVKMKSNEPKSPGGDIGC